MDVWKFSYQTTIDVNSTVFLPQNHYKSLQTKIDFHYTKSLTLKFFLWKFLKWFMYDKSSLRAAKILRKFLQNKKVFGKKTFYSNFWPTQEKLLKIYDLLKKSRPKKTHSIIYNLFKNRQTLIKLKEPLKTSINQNKIERQGERRNLFKIIFARYHLIKIETHYPSRRRSFALN